MKKKNKKQVIKKIESKGKLKPAAANLPVKGEAKEYSFYQDVFDVARQIPKGRVTSYGAIAAYIGTKLSARMVGWAMNAATNAKPKVPAHRVVNRNGMLSGKHHFATPALMEELLKKDGVAVKNDTVVDFNKIFWNPAEELVL